MCGTPPGQLSFITPTLISRRYADAAAMTAHGPFICRRCRYADCRAIFIGSALIRDYVFLHDCRCHIFTAIYADNATIADCIRRIIGATQLLFLCYACQPADYVASFAGHSTPGYYAASDYASRDIFILMMGPLMPPLMITPCRLLSLAATDTPRRMLYFLHLL